MVDKFSHITRVGALHVFLCNVHTVLSQAAACFLIILRHFSHDVRHSH